MKKKVIPAFLSVAMAAAAVPMPVMAEGVEESNFIINEEKDGSEESETEDIVSGENETEEAESVEGETEEAESDEGETEEAESDEGETEEAESGENETEEAEGDEGETGEAESGENETEEAESDEGETGEAESGENETGEPEDDEEENDDQETVSETSLSVRSDIAGGSVVLLDEEAAVGETVTFTAVPDEGYILTSVGYWTVKENGAYGKLTTVTAGADGKYSFEMPAGNVMIGAAFQNQSELVMYDNRIGGTKETDWSVYIAMEEAFLSESAASAAGYLQIDERFLEQEDLTLLLELRQWTDAGYKTAGTKEFTIEQVKDMIANPEAFGVEVTQDEETGTVIIEHLQIEVDEDTPLEEGYYAYMVAQFAKAEWIDARGRAEYRWGYTMLDATVLDKDAKIPRPIVWLYNLDEGTHRGELIRKILRELEIECGTVNNENLNQNIGYLVGWEGYEATEDPYSSESPLVEYMLMGNLPEVKMDELLAAMQENNIFVALKSQPTAWTASKTFAELFDIMSAESETFRAIFALDDLIYDAEQLSEEAYGTKDNWTALTAALEAANTAMGLEEDELEDMGGAAYLWEIYDALQKQYLLITGKEMLNGHLELILEENEDGTYNLSAKVTGTENPTFSYAWKYKSTTTENILKNVPKKDLYKVKLEVTGTDAFYGTLTASLSVPETPAYTVSANQNSISVTMQEVQAALNVPKAEKYVAALYKGDALLEEKTLTAAGTAVFSGLTGNTAYTVKVYAENAVGYSDIAEKAVLTTSSSDSGGSSSGGSSGGSSSDGSSGGSSSDGNSGGSSSGGNSGGSSSGGNSGGSSSGGNSGGSSSGGSSSNKKPGSTTNKTETSTDTDGSETTQTTDKDGTVIESTKHEDGTVTVVETKKDGTVIITETAADGTMTKTVESTDGSVTEIVTTPDGTAVTTTTDVDGNETAVVDTAKDNTTLPMEMDVEKNRADAPSVTIHAPEGQAEVTVTIPLDGASAGTVAVIVNADGTEMIVRDVVIGDDAMTMTIADGTTLKFVDNSKDFSDVSRGDWFKDAVDFASSHELFSGTSADAFSPNTAMTRGMLAVVLHNLSHNAAAAGEAGFTDVAGQYYADAAAWAANAGIISGYGNGQFGANDPVTREQLAMMLYRYAGTPAVNGGMLVHTDADTVSDYANTAVQWAVENGVISGNTDGTLHPKGEATRAQVASMLMRFCKALK